MDEMKVFLLQHRDKREVFMFKYREKRGFPITIQRKNGSPNQGGQEEQTYFELQFLRVHVTI